MLATFVVVIAAFQCDVQCVLPRSLFLLIVFYYLFIYYEFNELIYYYYYFYEALSDCQQRIKLN